MFSALGEILNLYVVYELWLLVHARMYVFVYVHLRSLLINYELPVCGSCFLNYVKHVDIFVASIFRLLSINFATSINMSNV